MGIQVLGAFQALNEAFSGDSEKQQKKAFQRNKADWNFNRYTSTQREQLSEPSTPLQVVLVSRLALPGASYGSRNGSSSNSNHCKEPL
jgi:hypothetical protein